MKFKTRNILALSFLFNLILVSIFANKIYNNWFELDVLKAPFRESIFAASPKDSGKIYFIGDSDIEAFELNEFLDNKDVRNRGIWGDVSSHVLTRMDVILNQQPSKIFLKIGQNDICSRVENDKIIDNVEKIIKLSKLKLPNINFYIISELPSEKPILHSNESGILKIRKLNEGYKLLANKYHVIFIDVYSHFINDDKLKIEYFYEDKAHLNGTGYLLFAKLLKPFVEG